MSLRSALGHARGLGSAKEGVHHFWMQRLTALALIPLTLWFVFSVADLSGGSYTAVLRWVREPATAVALVLFLAALLYHSMLGVQVVIEDYIAHEGWKLTGLVLSKFLHLAVAVASIFAVLKVALA